MPQNRAISTEEWAAYAEKVKEVRLALAAKAAAFAGQARVDYEAAMSYARLMRRAAHSKRRHIDDIHVPRGSSPLMHWAADALPEELREVHVQSTIDLRSHHPRNRQSHEMPKNSPDCQESQNDTGQ